MPSSKTVAKPKPKPTPAAESPIRRRRRPAEVRALILETARELFAARGLRGTSTRDIAAEAGVTEAAIYRHFGTKAKLFEAAIAEPFHEFISTYMDTWARQMNDPMDTRDLTMVFVTTFYDFLREHRRLIQAYIHFTTFEPDGFAAGSVESVLSRELRQIDEATRHDAAARGWAGLDISMIVRGTVAVVLAFGLHDDLLFPPGPEHPSRERIIRGMHAFIMEGLKQGRG